MVEAHFAEVCGGDDAGDDRESGCGEMVDGVMGRSIVNFHENCDSSYTSHSSLESRVSSSTAISFLTFGSHWDEPYSSHRGSLTCPDFWSSSNRDKAWDRKVHTGDKLEKVRRFRLKSGIAFFLRQQCLLFGV